jgi:catechol 2,3-dioxygenase-like lactoylglutathione lyase family enzyme
MARTEEGGPLTRIVLLVSDLRRSSQFYRALGFKPLSRQDDSVRLALGDDVVELRSDALAAIGPHYFTPEIDRFPRGTGVEIAFETPDVDALYDLARTHDVDLVERLEDGPATSRAFRVADPDGYLLRFTRTADLPAPRVRTVAARA